MNERKHSLGRLRAIVHELFDARYQGADAARILRAQGLADGYMRALSDLGIVRDAELLALVDREQRHVARKFNRQFEGATTSSETAPHPA